MSDEHLAYNASQAAYGSQKHHDYLVNNGYEHDLEMSTNNARTYSKKGGQTFIAYKGTDPTNKTDLEADLAIAVGNHRFNKEFVNATTLARKVKEKYGGFIATGHSLGGTKAIETANDHASKAIVFNPGTGIKKLKTGNHKVYIKSGDIISKRVDGANVTTTAGGHSLDGYESMFNPQTPKPMVGRKRKRGWTI